MRRSSLVAPMAAMVALASAPALADMTKDQCVDANSKGQDLRRDRKFSAAREQFHACSDPSCPSVVRDDCTKRLDELDRAQPTIAFGVKDVSGSDVSAVKVTVDGRPLADKLEGAALAVDPGQHVFTFTREGHPPITRTMILTEGDKGRREQIVLESAPAPPAPAPTATPTLAATPAPAATATPTPKSSEPSPPPEPPTESGHGGGIGSQKIAGLVVGGVGIAGIAVGSVFGMMVISQKNQQVSDCASAASCTSTGHAQALADHSTGENDSTISTVGFVAGGALLVGGIVLFATGRPASSQPAGAGLVVAPSLGPGGGGMLLRGQF